MIDAATALRLAIADEVDRVEGPVILPQASTPLAGMLRELRRIEARGYDNHADYWRDRVFDEERRAFGLVAIIDRDPGDE